MRSDNAWQALAADIENKKTIVGKEEGSMFFHPSENPRIPLVNYKLNGKNFLTWKRHMIIALRAKTKIGFVDGTIPMPEEDSDDLNDGREVIH